MANPLPRQSQAQGPTVINPTPLQDPAKLRTVLVCCKNTWMPFQGTEISLRRYFTNSAASGGGPVERVVTLNVCYTYAVHFRNHKDAVNVCRDNHVCHDVLLSVFLYDEQSRSVYSGRHTVSSRDSLEMSVNGVDVPLVDREASTTVLVTGVRSDVTDYNVESALGCGRRRVQNIKCLYNTRIAFVQFQHHEDALRAVGMMEARVYKRQNRTTVVNLFLFRGPIPDHTNPQHKTEISVIEQQEDGTMMLPANNHCTLSKDHTDTVMVKPQTVQSSTREVSQPEVVREGRQWRQELMKLDVSQLETLARAGGSTDDVMAVWKRYPPENYKKVLINTCLATVSGSELVKVVLSLVKDLTLLVSTPVGHDTSVETDTSPGDPITPRHDMATQTNTPGTVSATQTESLEMDSATQTELLAAADVSVDMLPHTSAAQTQIEFKETLTQQVQVMLDNQEARSLAQTRQQNRQIERLQSLLQEKVQMESQMEAKLAAMQAAVNQLESRMENHMTGLEAGATQIQTQLKDEMHQMQNEMRSDFRQFKTQLRDDARDQRSETNELRSDVNQLFSQQRQLRSEFNQNQAQHRADVMQQETQLQHQLQTIMDTVNTQTQASLQMQDRMHKNQMVNLVGEMRNIKTEVIGIRSQLAAQAGQTTRQVQTTIQSQLAAQAGQTTRQVQATNRAEPTMLVLAIANTSDSDSTSGDSTTTLPVD